MRTAFLVAVIGAACGFPRPALIGNDATSDVGTTDTVGTPADGASDSVGMPTDVASNPADAPSAQPRCDPTKPFGAPTPLAIVNSPLQEVDFELSQDEKTGFVTRYTDLSDSFVGVALSSQRKSADDALGTPSDSAMTAINAVATVFKVLPGSSGREIYVSRETDRSLFQAGIYSATRSDDAAKFDAGTLVTVDGLSTVGYADPILSADEQTLYFIADSNRFSATRLSRSAFVHKRNEGNWTHRSILSSDELTLYTGEFVGVSAEVMVSTRANKLTTFGTGMPLEAVNSSADDVPVWITRDSCVLYISSNRPGGGADGTLKIWEAHRPL